MSSPTAASGTSPALAQQWQRDDTASIHANLTERFEILKLLGTAGNSFCFAARDLATRKTPSDQGRLVRLKVLSDDAAVDQVQKELFYLEAAAAASLSHQNIVRTTEAEELGGVHFCTIEQSPNTESLRGLLDLRSWLEVDVAVSIALQIADALDYAHQKEVLHLNLKPENILIETDGRVLVTDFGIGSQPELAWARGERSRRHCLRYSSPEQIQGSQADCRSDFYSVGIILFEMLTDRVPFDSMDAELIKRKHLTQAPHPPQLFRQGISNYLSALVLTLLEKNPDWRLRTAAQLQTGLSRAAQPESAAGAKNDPLRYDEEEDSFELDSQPLESASLEFPPIESQSIEPASIESASFDATIQSRELDFIYPMTYSAPPDVAADNMFQAEVEAETAENSITHREFFEPPTITRIDPPSKRSSERKARIEPPSRTAAERVYIRPFSLYASTDKSQRKRQAIVFLAIMLVILLLISLLGRNHLSSLFTTASAGQQNNLPDSLDASHITSPELASQETANPETANTETANAEAGPSVTPERTGLDETQNQLNNSGLSADIGSLPNEVKVTPEKVTPPKKRYVRRWRSGRAAQSAGRRLKAKRKVRRPRYVRRVGPESNLYKVNDWLKVKEL